MKILFLILALLAVFGMFSGSTEPTVSFLRDTKVEPYLLRLHNGNSIVFNLSVGYLVSFLFWILVVYIPERNRRMIFRENLRHSYQNFRKSTIEIFLHASIDSVDSELLNELCDHQKFKDFFNENNNERWYSTLNGLQENKNYVDELLLELELFASELTYVLNNVNFQDPEVHLYFKQLWENIYRLKNSTIFSADQIKYLGEFLYCTLAQWSITHGKLKNDVIQKMIEAL